MYVRAKNRYSIARRILIRKKLLYVFFLFFFLWKSKALIQFSCYWTIPLIIFHQLPFLISSMIKLFRSVPSKFEIQDRYFSSEFSLMVKRKVDKWNRILLLSPLIAMVHSFQCRKQVLHEIHRKRKSWRITTVWTFRERKKYSNEIIHKYNSQHVSNDLTTFLVVWKIRAGFAIAVVSIDKYKWFESLSLSMLFFLFYHFKRDNINFSSKIHWFIR